VHRVAHAVRSGCFDHFATFDAQNIGYQHEDTPRVCCQDASLPVQPGGGKDPLAGATDT
jgi:hypothetical protein